MTVGELRKILADVPDDYLVVSEDDDVDLYEEFEEAKVQHPKPTDMFGVVVLS